MMKRIAAALGIFTLTLFACSSSKETFNQTKSEKFFYLCTTDTIVVIYQYENTDIPIGTIPNGWQLIAKSNKQPFRQIEYGDLRGYIKYRIFKVETKFKANDLPNYAFNKKDSAYVYAPSGIIKTTPSRVSNGGTVQVKGYYRKDGTYVQPHTRSAPRRKN